MARKYWKYNEYTAEENRNWLYSMLNDEIIGHEVSAKRDGDPNNFYAAKIGIKKRAKFFLKNGCDPRQVEQWLIDIEKMFIEPKKVLKTHGKFPTIAEIIEKEDQENMEWTKHDSDSAREEGWGVFFCSGSVGGEYQIQRIDEAEVNQLDSDERAWELVASRSTEVQKKAYDFIKAKNEKEFNLYILPNNPKA